MADRIIPKVGNFEGVRILKINEVFERLIKNRDEVYTTKVYGQKHELSIDNKGYFSLQVTNRDGHKIDSSLGGGGFNGNINADYEWKLEQREVSWQEGLQAWLDGKEVDVKTPIAFGGEQCFLRENGMFSFDRDVFTIGKWFVR